MTRTSTSARRRSIGGAEGTRHVPMRTCVGCRVPLPAPALIRCGVDAGERPYVGSGPGRGAWICSVECLDRAERRGEFARAWRRRVERSVYTELRRLVTQAMQETPDPGTLSDGSTKQVRTTHERRSTTKG